MKARRVRRTGISGEAQGMIAMPDVPPAEGQAELALPDAGKITNTRRFELFHQQNPDVWRLFVKYAFNRINAGFTNYSARDIMPIIRWDTEVVTQGVRVGYKINNIYSPFYARLFHRTYPQHKDFFRTRIAEADGA